MPEEEPEDENENIFDILHIWASRQYPMKPKISPKKLTKEQWRIAYWKLRRQYRKGQLNLNLR